MDLFYSVYHAAFEKRGISFNAKGALVGTGKFLASIPLWSAGSEAVDKATGGEKVDKENVYLPVPLFRRVMEQQRQAKVKENMTSGMKGV